MTLSSDVPTGADSPGTNASTRTRVLIVDDERDFLAMVALTLQQTGRYEVRGESDGRRALEVARQFRPDVILLDVMMPEVDGGDVAAQLHADPATAAAPIIFLTALVARQEMAGGTMLESGGHCYLPKPIEVEELERCLTRVLSQTGRGTAHA